VLDDNTIPLPRRRGPSGSTVAGLMALLLLAVGGLMLGMAVGSWPRGAAPGPRPVLSLPPDPPSDAPTVPALGPTAVDPSEVAPGAALVAGPAAPSGHPAVVPAVPAAPIPATRPGKRKAHHRR